MMVGVGSLLSKEIPKRKDGCMPGMVSHGYVLPLTLLTRSMYVTSYDMGLHNKSIRGALEIGESLEIINWPGCSGYIQKVQNGPANTKKKNQLYDPKVLPKFGRHVSSIHCRLESFSQALPEDENWHHLNRIISKHEMI